MHIHKYIAAVLLIAASSAHAQPLCPARQYPSVTIPELREGEGTFTDKAALDSLDWLEHDFVAVVKQSPSTYKLLEKIENLDGLGIPYRTSIRVTKGALLHLRALLAQSQLESEQLKLKAGFGSTENVRSAQENLAVVRNEFCKAIGLMQ